MGDHELFGGMMPDFANDPVDRWAKRFYEMYHPKLVANGFPWDIFRTLPRGLELIWMAERALTIHLECCEQRCRQCGDMLTHQCLRCNRA